MVAMEKLDWTFWLWQGWLLLLTVFYGLFMFVAITLFDIFLPPENEPTVLMRLMMGSVPFWCVAGATSWIAVAVWSRRRVSSHGREGMLFPALWHLSWMLFSFFAATAALFLPMFSVASLIE